MPQSRFSSLQAGGSLFLPTAPPTGQFRPGIEPHLPFLFLISQMKVCMDEFRSLAARYSDLHQSSFDADYATLRNVELYPPTSVCLSLSFWLRWLCWFLCDEWSPWLSVSSQQQSCLLISHVIEALILDPQAARWAQLILNLKCLHFYHLVLFENSLARKGENLSRIKPFIPMYVFFA